MNIKLYIIWTNKVIFITILLSFLVTINNLLTGKLLSKITKEVEFNKNASPISFSSDKLVTGAENYELLS